MELCIPLFKKALLRRRLRILLQEMWGDLLATRKVMQNNATFHHITKKGTEINMYSCGSVSLTGKKVCECHITASAHKRHINLHLCFCTFKNDVDKNTSYVITKYLLTISPPINNSV